MVGGMVVMVMLVVMLVVVIVLVVLILGGVDIFHHNLCTPTDWGFAKQMLVGRVLSRSFSI